MPTKKEKLKMLRKKFREKCFARDNHLCVVCGHPATAVHHIIDRHHLPNDGYTDKNGISLCDVCHSQAEVFHNSGGTMSFVGYCPEDLSQLIGSSSKEAEEASKLL